MCKSAFLASICSALIATLALAEEMKPIDVPAGDLIVALKAFARQTGVEVVYRTDRLEGMRTQGVKGTLSPQDALARILEGTALALKTDPSGAVLITAPAGQADAGKEQAEGEARVAQTDSATAREEPQGSTERDSADKLDEIVVTATRRLERIQDVPMSITAISAQDIDRRGLVSAEDYLRGIPGVNQVGDVVGSAIVIRGISASLQDQNFSAGTTVATYFGETPTTNSAGLAGNSNIDVKLVDVERVEVLRGPQGTSFGNSALGGAVRTIPVSPKTEQVEGKVSANYSVTSGTGSDNHMYQAVGNLPLIQGRLAVRASAARFEDSGYYRNVAASDPAIQAAAIQYGAETLTAGKDELGGSRFTSGRIAALFQATDNLKFTVGYLAQKTEIDGVGLENRGPYEMAMFQVAPEHTRRGQRGGLTDTDIDLSNITMEYNLGWADLIATASYIDSGSIWTSSLSAFGFVAPISQAGDSTHREHSGEVRLVTQLEGAWNFLGGVYTEELDDSASYNYIWNGDVAEDIFNPGESDLGAQLHERNLRQKAAFAEASWKFLPKLELSAGVRAYDFERDNLVVSNGVFFGGASSTPTSGDASGTSLRSSLSYAPQDDMLLYASWSQGFRLGQPQAGLPSGLCDVAPADGILDGTNLPLAITRETKSDTLDNYEIGGKFTLFDRRVMIAADVYRIDWTGLPVRTNAQCGFAYNVYAGTARSEGFEAQTTLRLTPALSVEIGGSTNHAVLTKDSPLEGFSAGDRLPGTPKFNANMSVQYDFAFAGHDAFVRADSTHIPRFNAALGGTQSTESGGYTKVDATARMLIHNLNVDVFVRNLTNVDELTYAAAGGLGNYRSRPRTYGVQLGYAF
jgi:outer membrane receptor protein involved in Fe transport